MIAIEVSYRDAVILKHLLFKDIMSNGRQANVIIQCGAEEDRRVNWREFVRFRDGYGYGSQYFLRIRTQSGEHTLIILAR